jgi:hypothetical protein
MKWAGWLGTVVTVIVALFALMLHGYYQDVGKTVETGKATVTSTVTQAKAEIDEVRQMLPGLKAEVTEIQSDVTMYKKVDSEIGVVQSQLKKVQGQIIDLGKHDLKVNSLRTTGPGPGYFGIEELGRPISTDGYKVVYFAQGSPPSLYQRTSAGEESPVSGRSTVGFQDISTDPKPTCGLSRRGTFFLEKGSGKIPDRPFVCARKSDNGYDWIQLVAVP